MSTGEGTTRVVEDAAGVDACETAAESEVCAGDGIELDALVGSEVKEAFPLGPPLCTDEASKLKGAMDVGIVTPLT